MSDSFIVELRNYRCFDWNHPARIEIKDGFVAIIGANNSGKSVFLKSIYELRHVWREFSAIVNNHPQMSSAFQSNGVSDLKELPNENDFSAFEITIESHSNDFEKFQTACIAQKVTLRIETCSQQPIVFVRSIVYLNKEGVLNSIGRDEVIQLMQDNSNCTVSFCDGPAISMDNLVEKVTRLNGARYYPAFRNAVNEGGNRYYDLAVGTSLVELWDQWKGGVSKESRVSLIGIEKAIASLLGFTSISIQADNQNKLNITINEKPYKLDEVGSGVAQLIIVLISALVEKPTYIFIDEPELNLHPSLQINLLSTLGSYTSYGIVFSTHSIGLARSVAEQIYIINRFENYSEMHPYNSKYPGLIECLGELSYSARSELGCEGVLLVEGATDVVCFQEFLRKINKDKKYIVMSLAGGETIKSGTADRIHELTRIVEREKIRVFIDSEKNHEDEKIQSQRKSFIDECEQIGISVVVSRKRATENYFTDRAIKRVLGNAFNSLQPFEKLRNVSPSWQKSLNWKMAREITFDEIKDSDLGEFLESL